jgi:cytochrome c oxidase subunit 4
MTAAPTSLRTYFVVYLLLLAGLAATVAAAYWHLGNLTIVVALTIAFAKATLVVLYFMHVRDSPELNWIAIAAGLVWLSILFGLTLADYGTRNWIPQRQTNLPAYPNDDRSNQPPRDASSGESQR